MVKNFGLMLVILVRAFGVIGGGAALAFAGGAAGLGLLGPVAGAGALGNIKLYL